MLRLFLAFLGLLYYSKVDRKVIVILFGNYRQPTHTIDFVFLRFSIAKNVEQYYNYSALVGFLGQLDLE